MADNCIHACEGLPAEFYRSETRRARKSYQCAECGETIERGDLHEYATGIWEGEWEAFRTCARCVNVRTDFFLVSSHTCMVEDFLAAHDFDYRDGIPEDFAPCGTVEEQPHG